MNLKQNTNINNSTGTAAEITLHDDTLVNTAYSDTIIIGAGAAGLMCAANLHGSAIILEATSRIGTKLLMSGNGHCNITHAGSIKDFPSCYGSAGRSIRKILYKYSNDDLIGYLESHGIKTITSEENRVFPESMCAQDIRDLLLSEAESHGFKVITNRKVVDVKHDSEYITVLATAPDGQAFSYAAKHLVVAAGGRSYPRSGSDGSMYDVLSASLGIEHTTLQPSLAPLSVADYPYGELAGISIDNISVSIYPKVGRRLAQLSGSVLLTHENFSGPVILNASKYAEAGSYLVLNYLGISREEAADRLNPDTFAGTCGDSKADILNRVNYTGCDSSAESLNQKIGVSCDKRAGSFNQKTGKRIPAGGGDLATGISSEFALPRRFAKLVAKRAAGSHKKAAVLLTEDRFEIESRGDFDKAMVTAGGLRLEQFDCKSMQLKSDPEIYCIGEILDVDGITGGYNLQFAWSSARAAAASISEK